MITAERLAQMWPEASRRLRTALEAQGVDRATAEDLVSEAVTRALATGLHAADVDDFCRWAYRVARNLHVDSLRAGARFAPVAEAEERAGGDDVTHVVEQRLLCESTLRWFATLPVGDRRAILAGLDNQTRTADRREAVRLAVRRHRARARLLKMVGGVTATLSAFRALLRSARVPMTSVAACATLLPGTALLLAPLQRPAAPTVALPPVTAAHRTVALVERSTPSVEVAAAVVHVAGSVTATDPAVDPAVHDGDTGGPGEKTPLVDVTPPPGVGDEDDGFEAGTQEGDGTCVEAPPLVLDCVDEDAPLRLVDPSQR